MSTGLAFCNPSVNGWSILRRNKLKVISARGTRGKGFSGTIHIVTFVFKFVNNSALDLLQEDFVKSLLLFSLVLIRSTPRKSLR